MPQVDSRNSVPLCTKIVVLAGGPAIALAGSLVQSILPKIEADLARSAHDVFLVKMLIGVMGIAMVIGASLTGFLADRIGLNRVMVFNYSLYALAGTAGVYLSDLNLLVASRFLLGIAASGAVTGSIIIINSRIPSQERASWLGYYVGVAQLSGVVLNPISGLLGEFNWHWSFAIYGIAAPFAFLAAATLPGKIPEQEANERAPAPPHLIRWFPFGLALIAIALGTITYIPGVYFPFLLSAMGMTSPALISLVLTGDIIAGTIAALFYGRMRRYLSEDGAFAISLGCTCLGLLISAVAQNYVVVICGSVIFGAGVAWFLPNLMLAVASRVLPEQQGRGAGLIKGANYLGSPAAVFLTEPIARTHGPPGAIFVASALSFVLLLFSLGRMATRRTKPTKVSSPLTEQPRPEH